MNYLNGSQPGGGDVGIPGEVVVETSVGGAAGLSSAGGADIGLLSSGSLGRSLNGAAPVGMN